MWVFTTKGFISAVADPDDPGVLVVRSRWKRDLQALFPVRRVDVTPERDYPFRVRCARSELAAVIGAEVGAVDYGNFKDACPEGRRAPYLQVWGALSSAAERERPRLDPRRGRFGAGGGVRGPGLP